jgi:hypothetical protein
MAATVTDVHREGYFGEGYTVLQPFSEAQLQELRGRAAAIPDSDGAFHTFERSITTGEVVVSRTEGFIWAGDEAGLAEFIGNSSPLAEAVSALVGEGPAVLFKEKLNYKLSGGGGYRAHQDGYTQIGPSSPSRKVLLALDSVVRVPAADY